MNFVRLRIEWDSGGMAPFLGWSHPVARGWGYGPPVSEFGRTHHVVRAQSCVILYQILRGSR